MAPKLFQGCLRMALDRIAHRPNFGCRLPEVRCNRMLKYGDEELGIERIDPAYAFDEIIRECLFRQDMGLSLQNHGAQQRPLGLLSVQL